MTTFCACAPVTARAARQRTIQACLAADEFLETFVLGQKPLAWSPPVERTPDFLTNIVRYLFHSSWLEACVWTPTLACLSFAVGMPSAQKDLSAGTLP